MISNKESIQHIKETLSDIDLTNYGKLMMIYEALLPSWEGNISYNEWVDKVREMNPEKENVYIDNKCKIVLTNGKRFANVKELSEYINK